MIKVSYPIIVEGKYDRIKLSSIIDGIIIETGGFRVFKDKEMIKALRTLANTSGIIILTDSDSSGFKIRNYIKGSLGKDAKIFNVYIPEIKGKEKRKIKESSEGLIGVEGISDEILIKAFENAGITSKNIEKEEKITKADLYDLRLIGFENSQKQRSELLKKLNLPTRLSSNSMIDLLNLLIDKKELIRLVKE